MIVLYRGQPVDLDALQERAHQLIRAGQSWEEMAMRGGYLYRGQPCGDALRQAIGMRPDRQGITTRRASHMADKTFRKLLAALILDPVDIGI